MDKLPVKIADKLLLLYAAPLNLILRCIPTRKYMPLKSRFFSKLCTGDEYCMLSAYPKRVDTLEVKGTVRDFCDTAIVLQGPIQQRDDFTLNTIRMYRKCYTNITVIVSTWADADAAAVEQMRQAGAVVVLSEYPRENFEGNLNYQLTNSLAGIREAKRLGAGYVLKSRTDQRLYDPCAMSLLMGMYQKGKLVVLGGVQNTFYARYFHISDFLVFGAADDVEQYFSCPFDSQDVVDARREAKRAKDFKEFFAEVRRADLNCTAEVSQRFEDAVTKYACPESVLAYNYFLKKTGQMQFPSVRDAYEHFLRSYVVVVDADSVGFYWLKYKEQAYRPGYYHRDGKLDAARWCALNAEESDCTGGP